MQIYTSYEDIMTDYTSQIFNAFLDASNADFAKGQSAYMKNKFEFFGIKSPVRKIIQKPFFQKEQRPEKKDLTGIIEEFWSKPQRELQYCGQELALKYILYPDEKDIELYEYMITHKSWWDTIDFIASNLVASYLRVYPDKRWDICKKWLETEFVWLQRSTLLFQLKYKNQLDRDLLEHNIKSLLGSDEFFINKAIGWILREYGKTDSAWVIQFVNKHDLNPLSKREALKIINR